MQHHPGKLSTSRMMKEAHKACKLYGYCLQSCKRHKITPCSRHQLTSAQDLALTSNIRPQSHVYEALGEEHAEGTPPVYGPFPEDHAPMKDKILEEGKTQLPKDGTDMPLPRGRERERTNDHSPKNPLSQEAKESLK